MKLDPIRALRIIEGLTVYEDDNKLIAEIYRIAHQAGSPDCSKNHPSWTDMALETEAGLVETKTIPPWNE